MTRREIWDTVYGAAAAAYEPREARAVAALVCEDRLGLRFTDVIVEPDAPCPLRDDLQRLAFEIGSYRPAQYIAGFCRFLRHFRIMGAHTDMTDHTCSLQFHYVIHIFRLLKIIPFFLRIYVMDHSKINIIRLESF